MLYFAYGSNMCTTRLRGRVPSAKFVRVARIPNYAFRFHKRSQDGSAKGDAYFTGKSEDVVWGAVFDIDFKEKDQLDIAEGLGYGYREADVMVTDLDNNHVKVFMYIAVESHIQRDLLPYSWYKRFVVAGAREHGLAANYIDSIESMPEREDPDKKRDAENRAIAC